MDRGTWQTTVLLLLLLSRFSCVWLFATLWTVACQAPLSIGFSWQEYWSRLPCPPPGDLPNTGTEPGSPVLQADTLLYEPWGKPDGSQQAMENSSRYGNIRPLYLSPEKTVCRSRSNSWNWTWNNRTGSQLGKEYGNAVYWPLAYLTYMQSTSYELPGWMNPKLESRLLGEVSTTSNMQMIPP